MILFYIISVIYLIVLFLMYKKTDKKLCFISSLIYSVCLLFCYNTFIVYMLYLVGIKGSFLIFSVINYIVGSIIGIVIYIKGKRLQKYFLEKKKLAVLLVLGLIVFLVGYFKFRGFTAINFESGDSAIHYGQSLKFSEELSILDKANSSDKVFGYFVRVMPISYINCGLLFNIFSGIKTYIVFLFYSVACLILSALLFGVTIIDIYKYKKKDYIFALILALCYVLAFPLNSMMMGFCYLTLGLMVINLLYLTMHHFKDNFDKKIIFKIVVLFLICFAAFYSYYLFVPAIYLAVGIYYIYLWRKGILSFKNTLLYGFITLIIPFIIGFSYFFITLFQDIGVEYVSFIINYPGFCYDNITPIYLFAIVTGYLGFKIYRDKQAREFNFLNYSLYIVTIYIAIFLVLYIFKRAELYYFYKLFFVYWLLLLLYFGKRIGKYRKYLYGIIPLVLVVNIVVYLYPLSRFASIFSATNIYTYNARTFIDMRIIFDGDDLELLEKSIEYRDICINNGRFPLIGNSRKNIWYYSITEAIPVIWPGDVNIDILYHYRVPNIKAWEYAGSEYPCLVYDYDNGVIDIDKDKYQVLYENKAGVIIKKKN